MWYLGLECRAIDYSWVQKKESKPLENYYYCMVNIIGRRKILYIISGIMFAVAVFALLFFRLKPGIDFTGGSLIELQFNTERPAVSSVQTTLAPLNLGPIVVQQAGDTSMILKLRFVTENEHQSVLNALRSSVSSTVTNDKPSVVETSFETIGSTVSTQLRDRVARASVLIILVIILFVAYAFRKVSKPVSSWKYGVAAVIAMVHDVIITMGIFALLGHFMGVEVDVPFVVAMLTVFGYSVNDTIVVFDRIRENLIRHSAVNFASTVNAAVNETLARSINSSLTIIIVLSCLYIIGGESIRFFSLALLIGIFLGTYSSIFVASALLVSWQERGK
jgi:preprotein translocase subunit SecF